MKGKIIEILKKYEGIEVAYQFNVATEREALTNKATSESIADEIIHLVNQEVERRIKERMPTKIDAQKKIFEICSHPDNIGKGLRGIISTPMKLEMYDEWYRSRLTPQDTPQDTPQVQMTECGYYTSEGRCLPGCMTDSCKHHPNNR